MSPPSSKMTMQAIHIPKWLPQDTGYPSLEPTTQPVPSPSPSNLLIAITHSSLNHVDLLYSRGLHQNNASGLVKPPFNLGLEFSGVVVGLPTDAKAASKCGFAVGDRVWGGCVGSFAEYVSVPPSAVRKVPEGTSLLDAAGLGAGSPTVSYGALVLCGGVKREDLVLVHAAAGGLGVPAVQIAHAKGAKVIATVGSDEKANVVRRELGQKVVGVVNYEVEGWEKEVVKIAKNMGKEGVDLVYDTVGLVLSSIRCVRFDGTIVIAGFAGRKGKMENVAMNRILLKNVRVLGYRYGESGRRDPEHTAECWRGTEELLAKGQMKPLIYKVLHGLDSVGGGLQELYERKVWGKAVVEIRKEEDVLREITAKAKL
jgi:NADPH:quinone reductase-like Zn-dependent oxidoreductase